MALWPRRLFFVIDLSSRCRMRGHKQMKSTRWNLLDPSGSLMFPTRTNSTCLCEPPGVFQETDDFLETGSKTLSFSITTPSHKKSHYTWRTDCVLVRTTFFPDRYVLRFGELSLWTGHREKFLAALKIEKTPLLLWVNPPPPLTAPVK